MIKLNDNMKSYLKKIGMNDILLFVEEFTS